MFDLSKTTRTLLFTGAFAGLALAVIPAYGQNGPPPSLARLSHLENGNISFQPNGEDSWGQSQNNQPMDPGDRVVTDQSGRGEVEAEPVRMYFGNSADLTLVSLDQNGLQAGVAQGSVKFASDGFGPNQSLSVQTPNGAVTVSNRAEFDVDVYPDQTIITNGPYNQVFINGGGGFALTLSPRQSVQLSGTNPVYAQPLGIGPMDDFDRWAEALESHRFNSISARYVSTQMAGFELLDNSGDWQPQSDYGPIWFPRVQAGWQPYHQGHWVNRPFYGWTWVADEPWGIAPFHYGRWAQVQGRWGWIPGPREQPPIWSPAQVVFAGGIQVGGVGISVWFPLGPGEPYHPWYPATPQYINQINITNIHESKVIHVQNTYVNVTNVTNITYVNRTIGVTAMKQEDFAAGHPAQVAAVKVTPQQLEHVQVAAPAARPPAKPVIVKPIAKPPAVAAARPVLINNKGQQAAAAPNARPVAVPIKAAPAPPKPIPGRAPIGTPTVGNKPAPAPAKAAAPAVKTPEPSKTPQPASQPAKAAQPASPAKALEPAKPATAPAKQPAQPAATPKAVPPATAAKPQLKETPAEAPKKAAPLTPKEPTPGGKVAPKPAPKTPPVPEKPAPKTTEPQAKTADGKPAPSAKDAKKAADEKKKQQQNQDDKKTRVAAAALAKVARLASPSSSGEAFPFGSLPAAATIEFDCTWLAANAAGQWEQAKRSNRMSDTMISGEVTIETRSIVSTNEAPKAIGPYSQAVRVGNLLYTSGQVALDPETQQLVGSNIAEQATQVLSNLKAILEAGGSSFAQVIKATVYLKNFEDFGEMNKVYGEHLAAEGNQPPARTTIEVARLPKDALIEIDLVALVKAD